MHHQLGLIVGLGNPGYEFNNTRHNYGFRALDWIIENAVHAPHCHLQRLPAHTHAELFEFSPEGPNHGYYLLAKPLTGINSSGEAVARVLHDHGFETADVLLIHDAMDLELGQARLDVGKSANHHNGVISVEELLGHADFPRIRLGIGRPESGLSIREWVMEPFRQSELKIVDRVLAEVWQGIVLLHLQGELRAEHFFRRW